MSNKTINELQLIDEVSSGVNLIGDDTIQTYRLTTAQLKAFINKEVNERIDLIEADKWVTRDRMNQNSVGFSQLNLKDNFQERKGLTGWLGPLEDNFLIAAGTQGGVNIAAGTGDQFGVTQEWGFLVTFGADLEVIGPGAIDVKFSINNDTPADNVRTVSLVGTTPSNLGMSGTFSKSEFFTLNNVGSGIKSFSLKVAKRNSGQAFFKNAYWTMIMFNNKA